MEIMQLNVPTWCFAKNKKTKVIRNKNGAGNRMRRTIKKVN